LEAGPERRIIVFESFYPNAKFGEFLVEIMFCIFELGVVDLNWKSIGILEKY
jgi:hypothetical protein